VAIPPRPSSRSRRQESRRASLDGVVGHGCGLRRPLEFVATYLNLLAGSWLRRRQPQMRPTSRQRMQRLADELAAEGLVEFIDNPKHRRSKLVQLTPKGDARYCELNARFLAIASTMGVGLSESDIRRTTEIVRRLSDDVKARSEQLS
jgi:hypothetical protein